jgi:hypothetical protein
LRLQGTYVERVVDLPRLILEMTGTSLSPDERRERHEQDRREGSYPTCLTSTKDGERQAEVGFRRNGTSRPSNP